MAEIRIQRVNYSDPKQGRDLVEMLNHYACDPAGGGNELSTEVKRDLTAKLAQRTDATSALAYDEDRAVGVLNCFEGFSTFAAAPLLNIHDIAVHADYRRRGVGRMLLAEAERIAAERGCCKITLEVLSNNLSAIKAYENQGFKLYELDPQFGQALFMEKKL